MWNFYKSEGDLVEVMLGEGLSEEDEFDEI